MAGFLAVQLIAMFLLSIRFVRQEPAALLKSDVSETQKLPKTGKVGVAIAVAGMVMLAAAYILSIQQMGIFSYIVLIPVLILGIWGTFLAVQRHGSPDWAADYEKNYVPVRPLYVHRPSDQENVLHQYKVLAVASLLLLLAIACVSYGIGVAFGRGAESGHSADFTITDTDQDVAEKLLSGDSAWMIKDCYAMRLGHMDIDSHTYNAEGMYKAISGQPQSDIRDNILENIQGRIDYFIAESSYNRLLASLGKEPLDLGENRAAMYTSMSGSDFQSILAGALKDGASIEIDGKTYELLPELYTDNVVADRQITLYNAYIVADEVYDSLVTDPEEIFAYNLSLSDALVEESGLMQAILEMGQVLDNCGLHYESYLAGIGRNLFYTVAGSYITIYLGVLFLIIANTVISLKYLIWQRKNHGRYMTLLMLGARKSDWQGQPSGRCTPFLHLCFRLRQ